VMSEHAASQAPSKLGLEPGASISVENAIKSIVTRSANDVAVAIAEAVGGDEDSFAAMMTRKAHALGMSHTTYVNASGLPDDRQITTAHDLTILGRAVQERFPRYFHYFSTHAFDYAGETIGNHNHLLGRVDGVDGIKTGYTRASGFNLLTSVHRDGRSLVAVVMGGPTAGARDRFMEGLIAQHIAGASTTRTATMVADASAPEPLRLASLDRRGSAASAPIVPPEPPARSMAIAAKSDETPPTPPARALLAEASAQEAEGEGDLDTVERDGPVDSSRNVADSRATAIAAAAAMPVPAAPLHSAETSPATRGWVKGPEGAARQAEQKSVAPTKVVVAALTPAAPLPPTPSPPAHEAQPTPASLGWVKGPDSVPSPEPRPATAAKAVVASHPKEETRIARSEEARSTVRDEWMIQIGASDNPEKVDDLLSRAKAANRSTLASAKPFTQKVGNGDTTFYRARFAGLDSASAEAACRSLKSRGFSCFLTRE
jgi:D-alanyl-D-alanine carboxypeptidase